MKQTSKLKMRRARFIFIMVLPAILFPMIFTYYPMIKGSLMAFQSYNLMNVKNIKWVGLDNFSKLFAHNTSNTFYSTMLNTVKWVGISLFVQFMVGFAMALLLKKKFKGSGLYQGLMAGTVRISPVGRHVDTPLDPWVITSLPGYALSISSTGISPNRMAASCSFGVR